MNNKLKLIASLVDPIDSVIDIGCDHAYLAIYLKKNHLCKEVYASDISKNALAIANKNIKDNNLEITTFLSDGFKDINKSDINTAIISGVGASTIINIMKHAPQNITKLITCSHSDLELLRKKMLQNKWYIEEEKVIYESKKYYNIIVFTKNYKKLSQKYLKYGSSKNKDYYNYLLLKKYDMLKRIPKKYLFKRIKIIKEIFDLKILIKRS